MSETRFIAAQFCRKVVKRIDKYAKLLDPDTPNRSQAIRRLVAMGLESVEKE